MGGRPLSLDEQAAIERDMEAIVLGSHLFKSLDDAGRKDLIESGFVMRFDAGDEQNRQIFSSVKSLAAYVGQHKKPA